MQILTIGHSTHPIDEFVELLHSHGIEAIADVRSAPASRFNPQFNKRALERAVHAAGVKYVFLGRELGGRPRDRGFYDAEGYVLYGRVADSDTFRDGFGRLVEGARRYRVAIMCAEGDPLHCHRRLLVTRVLQTEGIRVAHVLPDGGVVSESELADAQQALFDLETTWRSARPLG